MSEDQKEPSFFWGVQDPYHTGSICSPPTNLQESKTSPLKGKKGICQEYLQILNSRMSQMLQICQLVQPNLFWIVWPLLFLRPPISSSCTKYSIGLTPAISRVGGGLDTRAYMYDPCNSQKSFSSKRRLPTGTSSKVSWLVPTTKVTTLSIIITTFAQRYRPTSGQHWLTLPNVMRPTLCWANVDGNQMMDFQHFYSWWPKSAGWPPFGLRLPNFSQTLTVYHSSHQEYYLQQLSELLEPWKPHHLPNLEFHQNDSIKPECLFPGIPGEKNTVENRTWW